MRILFCYSFLLIFSIELAAKNNYIKNEIIVKFKKDYLTNTYLNSKGEFLKTKHSLMLSIIPKKERESFKNVIKDTTGDKTEIRKVARKFMPKDSISISRNGKEINISDILNICVIDLKDTTRNIKEICDSLSKLDFIIYAEPNYLIELNDNPPNDPRYYLQNGLEQSYDIDIDANRAWDFTTGNSGIRVGVIDNGIDYDHEDLGNGLFGVSGAKVRGGWDYINNDSDPDYIEDMSCSHGTEVAGIIGAVATVIGAAGVIYDIFSDTYSTTTETYNENGDKVTTTVTHTDPPLETYNIDGTNYDCEVIGIEYQEFQQSTSDTPTYTNLLFEITSANLGSFEIQDEVS